MELPIEQQQQRGEDWHENKHRGAGRDGHRNRRHHHTRNSLLHAEHGRADQMQYMQAVEQNWQVDSRSSPEGDKLQRKSGAVQMGIALPGKEKRYNAGRNSRQHTDQRKRKHNVQQARIVELPQIRPNLYLGNHSVALDDEALAKHKIHVIINVGDDVLRTTDDKLSGCASTYTIQLHHLSGYNDTRTMGFHHFKMLAKPT